MLLPYNIINNINSELPYALVLGGNSTDKVTMPTSSLLDDLSTETVAMWVYPTTITDLRRFYDKNTNTRAFRFVGNNVGVIAVEFMRATQTLSYRNSQTDGWQVTTNEWQFLAYSFNANAAANNLIKLYRGTQYTPPIEQTNGLTQDGSGAYTSDAAGQWLIGNRSDNARVFQGNIASFTLWNRDLSLYEITQFWQTFKPVSGILTHWVLGLYGTGPILDLSGNGFHGTVTTAVPVVNPVKIPYMIN